MPTDFDASGPLVPDDRTLSVDDVAKILNVSRPYVVALADSGQLGVVVRTEDGKRRIRAAAVEAYRTERITRSRDSLDELAAISQGAGLYNADRRGS
ncbi:helix-turn-helix domain-containing protein [Burkholderia sp. PAMC 26561]|uniref:helix-turn-helix domain-containing protein n=1 Tax=Burkholderia sp. PAMC 26561 TaxID=1795043 RepID=UPI000783FE43|nr:helix-turn-helix domain-containing protein [Burkholderia sp. PAMC 26561]